MSMRVIRALLLMALLLPATRMLAADSPFVYDHMVGNWKVQCSRESCLVMLYITHSAGNNTTVVKVDRAGMKPDNFGIVISGEVDEEKGLTAQFVKTVIDISDPVCKGGPDKPKPVHCYHQELQANKSFNGILDCGYQKCFAKFPGQYLGAEGTPDRIDLLKEYENNDALLVMWNDKHGNLKSVMLDIDGFKQAYDTALSVLGRN